MGVPLRLNNVFCLSMDIIKAEMSGNEKAGARDVGLYDDGHPIP